MNMLLNSSEIEKGRLMAAISERQASWNQMVSQPSGVG